MAAAQRRADRVERVSESADDAARLQVGRAGLDVSAVRLEPLVVVGCDVEAEDVNRLGLAVKAGGQLLRDEAVRPIGDLEHPVDRVVVGDRHEVHAPPLGELIDLLRRCRAFGQAQGALHAQARDRRGRGVAVEIDSGAHALVLLVVVRCHERKIPLQIAAFCDQAVNAPARYQDLHLPRARGC